MWPCNFSPALVQTCNQLQQIASWASTWFVSKIQKRHFLQQCVCVCVLFLCRSYRNECWHSVQSYKNTPKRKPYSKETDPRYTSRRRTPKHGDGSKGSQSFQWTPVLSVTCLRPNITFGYQTKRNDGELRAPGPPRNSFMREPVSRLSAAGQTARARPARTLECDVSEACGGGFYKKNFKSPSNPNCLRKPNWAPNTPAEG